MQMNKDIQSRFKTTKVDLWCLIVILAVLNVPLLFGSWNSAATFLPGAVAKGEWWRIMTGPFVHISVYHLLIDGLAVLLLYTSLDSWRLSWRVLLCAVSALVGMLIPLWAAPAIHEIGLCGLSGVAHGLMAVCALDLCGTQNRKLRRLGLLSFAVVLVKCIGEAMTGRLLFDLVHFGNVGVPIVTCHAGGMLGALVVWCSKSIKHSRPVPQALKETVPAQN